MPFTAVLVRVARPYADDFAYSGAYLRGDRLWAKLFYADPMPELIGLRVEQGRVFATAQDITAKTGEDGLYREQGMLPHIHLEIIKADPAFFFDKKSSCF